MTEADAKQRLIRIENLFHGIDRVFHHGRIAGPVRNKIAMRSPGVHLGKRGFCREDLNIAATADQFVRMLVLMPTSSAATFIGLPG